MTVGLFHARIGPSPTLERIATAGHLGGVPETGNAWPPVILTVGYTAGVRGGIRSARSRRGRGRVAGGLGSVPPVLRRARHQVVRRADEAGVVPGLRRGNIRDVLTLRRRLARC